MFLLRPLEEEEESYKLLYAFTKNNNPMWKQNYLMSLKMQDIGIIQQETMSDYEYFKFLHKMQKRHEEVPSKNYMFMVNREPLVNVYVMMRNSNIADISFVTDIRQRKKGFATQALKLTEQLLFQNPNILFTTIKDVTPTKISSKIALKKGYEFNEETRLFIKANPNINLEDLIENKR